MGISIAIFEVNEPVFLRFERAGGGGAGGDAGGGGGREVDLEVERVGLRLWDATK